MLAALFGILILLAVGVLALTMASQDIRMSANLVGQHRAAAATETGVHRYLYTFNPETAPRDGNGRLTDINKEPVNAATDADATLTYNVTEQGQISYKEVTGDGGPMWNRVYRVVITGNDGTYNASAQVIMTVQNLKKVPVGTAYNDGG